MSRADVFDGGVGSNSWVKNNKEYLPIIFACTLFTYTRIEYTRTSLSNYYQSWVGPRFCLEIAGIQ